MRIAIFGASGATGQLLTNLALAAGHQVTALARTPNTFPQRSHPAVRLVPGDALNPAAIADTLTGADAVLSALGARSLGREEVLERAIPLLVAAMEATGPRRLVTLGSAGALPTSLDKQPAYRRWIVQNLLYNTVLKYPVLSQISQYQTLSASTLDWTMVMPPMLTNGPARGTFRLDPEALPRNGSRISRADVAAYMFAQLTTPAHPQTIYITW